MYVQDDTNKITKFNQQLSLIYSAMAILITNIFNLCINKWQNITLKLIYNGYKKYKDITVI